MSHQKTFFFANLFNLALLHHIIIKQSINNNTVVAKIYSFNKNIIDGRIYLHRQIYLHKLEHV